MGVPEESTMPMHDWTRVMPGIFHDFHYSWISTIRDALNAGLLPDDYYALAEQIADGPIPDVLTLERMLPDEGAKTPWTPEAEQQIYSQKANRVAVFHATGDRVVAYVEIVSPGNKHSDSSIRKFLAKLEEALERGCHLLVIDPHRPTVRDPNGLHARFWTEVVGQPDSPGVTADESLAAMAYRSDVVPTAYFTPFAVGGLVPEMPLFLDPDRYIDVPLEQTYQNAWTSVPARWKHVIEGE